MFYALKERFSPFISQAKDTSYPSCFLKKTTKEIREGGIFLGHYYELGYKKQNTVQTIENFRHFEQAYNFYKEHDCNYFIEIEVWQYNGKQEIVVLDWNESKEKFEVE